MGVGLALGAGAGVALDNLPIGVAVGLVPGVAMDAFRKDTQEPGSSAP
jgi:hypothetical protein